MKIVLMVIMIAALTLGCNETKTAPTSSDATIERSLSFDDIGRLHNEGMCYIDRHLATLHSRNRDEMRSTARRAAVQFLTESGCGNGAIRDFDREFNRHRPLKLVLKSIDYIEYDEQSLLTQVLTDSYEGKLTRDDLIALQMLAPPEYIAYNTYLAVAIASSGMDPWTSIPQRLDYWDIWVQDAVGGLIGGAFGGPPGAIGGALGASAGQLIDNYMN